jgi:hydroxyethylthiazole kinase
MKTVEDIAHHTGQLLDGYRSGNKTIHCIASSAEESFTLRILDAIGATVTMTHDPREVADFISTSDVLLVQLGATSEMRESGILTAIDEARRHQKPWVLDTMFVRRSVFRAELARAQIARRPAIVRSTSGDLATLMARNTVSPAQIATRYNTVAVGSDPDNLVSDGVRTLSIEHCAPSMRNVRMLNSARAALCAAMASIEIDAFHAAVAGLATVETAAGIAKEKALGPGTFSIAFLDALASIGSQDIASNLSVNWH